MSEALKSDYVAGMSQLLELSKAMLALMQEGDWLAARRLDQQRQVIIDSLVDLPKDSEAIAVAMQLVSELNHCNQRLVELGQEQLAKYTETKKTLDKRRRAVLAYSV